LPLHARACLLEAVVEEGTVGEPGEGIVQGLVLELLLGSHLDRDVGLQSDDPLGGSDRVADRKALCQDPVMGAVPEAEPVPMLEVQGLAVDELLKPGSQRPEVVGMNEVEPARGGRADVALAIAGHGRPAVRVEHSVLLDIPVPPAVDGLQGCWAPGLGANLLVRAHTLVLGVLPDPDLRHSESEVQLDKAQRTDEEVIGPAASHPAELVRLGRG